MLNSANFFAAVLVFYGMFIIPPFLAGVGVATSTLLGVLCMASFSFFPILLSFSLKANTQKAFLLALFLFFFIIVHLLCSFLLAPVDLLRAVSSLIALVIVICAAGAFADLLLALSPLRLAYCIKYAFLSMLLMAFCGYFRIFQFYSEMYPKPVFPFSEPSHFALLMIPLLIANCAFSSSFKRGFCVIAGFLCAFSLENLTLLAGCFLVVCLCLPKRYVALSCVALAAVLLTMDASYYLDRLMLSDSSDNLSALVFLQGWQLIIEYSSRTFLFGTGFQQLGLQDVVTPATHAIRALTDQGDLNLLDGGFTLAKVLCEFGIFGAVGLLLYAIVFVNSAYQLRKHCLGLSTCEPRLIFAHSFVVAFIVELCVRGAGYFTPSIFFVLVSLFVLHSLRKKR